VPDNSFLASAVLATGAVGATYALTQAGGSSDEDGNAQANIQGIIQSAMSGIPSTTPDVAGLAETFAQVSQATSGAGMDGTETLEYVEKIRDATSNVETQYDKAKSAIEEATGSNNTNSGDSGGNAGNIDEEWWKNWRENSEDVSTNVGKTLWDVTGGVVGNAVNEGATSIKETINPPNQSDPTGTPDSTEGQLDLASSAFNPTKTVSDGMEKAKQTVQENVGNSSSSSSSRGSTPTDKAKESVNRTKEQAKENINKQMENLGASDTDVKEKAKERKDNVQNRIQDAFTAF